MVHAIDDSGVPVDWWFIYKLPQSVKTKAGKKADSKGGNAYLYFDAQTRGGLRLSKNLLTSKAGALRATLQQLEDARADDDSSVGWYQYNDQRPGASSKNDEKWGHTKGVVVFDTKDGSAYWLLHSTPRFPIPGTTVYPEKEGDDLAGETTLPVNTREEDETEAKFGQTFLCISLSGIDDVEAIATQMKSQQVPQVYDSRLPKGLDEASAIASLISSDGNSPNPEPSIIKFKSSAGVEFQSVAKSRVWGRDLWVDLVGHHFDVALDVESWRNGTGVVPASEDTDRDSEVDDVQEVDLQPLVAGDDAYDVRWKYTVDHSKWGVSEHTDQLFVGDINRKSTQSDRGGGTIAFRHKALRDALASMVQATTVSDTPDQAPDATP